MLYMQCKPWAMGHGPTQVHPSRPLCMLEASSHLPQATSIHARIDPNHPGCLIYYTRRAGHGHCAATGASPSLLGKNINLPSTGGGV
jgi:hypothetical protein